MRVMFNSQARSETRMGVRGQLIRIADQTCETFINFHRIVEHAQNCGELMRVHKLAVRLEWEFELSSTLIISSNNNNNFNNSICTYHRI